MDPAEVLLISFGPSAGQPRNGKQYLNSALFFARFSELYLKIMAVNSQQFLNAIASSGQVEIMQKGGTGYA